MIFIEHWQYILDDSIISLQRTGLDIQSYAIAALSAFSSEYYKQADGTAIPDIQGKMTHIHLLSVTYNLGPINYPFIFWINQDNKMIDFLRQHNWMHFAHRP